MRVRATARCTREGERVVGWGQQTSDQNPPAGTVGYKMHGTSHISETADYEFKVGEVESDVRKCHGDSGGPSFMEVETDSSENWRIVGVTSHYVTENLDQGPIIFQDSFKVTPEDTLESIKKRGQKLEATTLLKAVKMHLDNKLEVRWRKVHTKNK